jgi:REP element-mobilizing transposase RayT
MNGENNKHIRHSMRLKGYDYSEEGAYFVTIVTYNREMLFGKVVEGEMVLNDFGEIVQFTWNDLINHFENIELAEYVIMPNHFHGIIIIETPVGVGSKPTPKESNICSVLTNEPSRAGHGPAPTSLPEIMRQFKTFSSKRINQLRGTTGIAIWQRGYYDHIIRDEKDYDNIVNYIFMNPSNWETDEEFDN